MIECIKLEVKVGTTTSHIDVVPLHKAVTEKLYVGRTKKTFFTINNHSEVDRKFWVTKVKNDVLCESDCETYEPRIVLANSSADVWFNFMITTLTKERQLAHFLVSFDNSPAQLISI